MSDNQSKLNEDKLLERCNQGLGHALLRLAAVFVLIAVFGLVLVGLLYIEILLITVLFGWSPDSIFLKGLILVILLFVLLTLIVWGFEKKQDGLLNIIARWLDGWFRDLDWCGNRGYWDRPWLPWPKPFYILPGHSFKPTLVAIVVATLLVLGPGRLPSDLNMVSYSLLVASVGMILVVTLLWPIWHKRFQFVPHLLVLSVLSLALYFWDTSATQQVVDAGPYRHFFVLAFWFIGVGIVIAAFVSHKLFAKYGGRLVPQTSMYTDSLDGPVQPLPIPEQDRELGIDWKRFARSLIKAPFYHPIEILFWPSLLILFVAKPQLMAQSAFYLGVAAWVVYAVGDMHEELDTFLNNVKRAFFRGGQLVISLSIIVLAAGRLFDNSYIRTLVEGEGLGEGFLGGMNNWVLFLYLASAYVLFWYFEYWNNRFVSERLLAMFESGTKEEPLPSKIGFKYREGMNKTENGVLAMLEASRYALLGTQDQTSGTCCVKRILGRTSLINEGISDQCLVDISVKDSKSKLKLMFMHRQRNYNKGVSDEFQIDISVKDSYGGRNKYLAGPEFKLVLLHRLRFYYVLIYLILVAGAGIAAYWVSELPQRAELLARQSSVNQKDHFNLRERLFSPQTHAQRPRILLAASGGGTRAAVYTYSVLSGLRNIGVLEDVVLASGVSGGSAAIAYFAMHRKKLLEHLSPLPGKCKVTGECGPWERFGAVMSAPYIQDVLRGASEWRMVVGCSLADNKPLEGLRLGMLLQESFDRRFLFDADNESVFSERCAKLKEWSKSTSSITRLGDQNQVGLIFNTALAGEFDSNRFECPVTHDCTQFITLSQLERMASDNDRSYQTTTKGKGGRLILTNLQISRNGVDGPQGPFPDRADALNAALGDYLNYKVINDPSIPLATAAALSANFPPVFPNAAVDVDDRWRYWVTDGGAMDNRGIISLLYALEGAINAEHECIHQEETEQRVDDMGNADTKPDQTEIQPCDKTNERIYPEIHILMAEASKTDPSYQQDRGITTTFGAAERFGSQLMVDKVKHIAQRYEELGGEGIYLHKLGMPLTLRSAGGIGTHWMLPQEVTLRAPVGITDQCKDDKNNATACWPESKNPVERFLRLSPPGVDITGEQAKRIVEALHWVPKSVDPYPEVCITEEKNNDSSNCDNVDRLWQQWVCKDPGDAPHPKSWYCLVNALRQHDQTDPEQTYYTKTCENTDIPACENTRINW